MDWGSLISSGLSAVGGYVNQQMQFKQAKKLAKIQAGSGGGAFPMLGTGNMSFATSQGMGGFGGYGPSYFTGAAPAQLPLGIQPDSAVGQVLNYFGAGGSAVARPRPQRVVYQTADGQVVPGPIYAFRYVGAPLVFRGDITNCKRTIKTLHKFSGKVGYRRRPR
jgi:hypothetical protein